MERSCDRPIGSFRAGDDPHHVNGLVPTPTTLPLRDAERGILDFKDLTLLSDKRCQRTMLHRDCDAAFHASDGGGRRDRTDDLLLAKQALSQLSYAPV